MSGRPWPFSLQNGLPDPVCASCGRRESYPGLWEVPVWALSYDGQVYNMDPGMGRQGSVRYDGGKYAQTRAADAVLKSAFDEAYYGNRAPLPIAVHGYWFNSRRMDQTKAFIKYVLSQPDVYFVTVRQLVDWMKDPKPAKETGRWLRERCRRR